MGASAGPADADARAHVLVPVEVLAASVSGVVLLGPDAHHHLARVLRLRVGDPVTVTDGRGRWLRSVVNGEFASSGGLAVIGSLESVAQPPEVGVAFALTKGDKPELVVQKLTELGVQRIVPFRAERSVVRWDDTKADRNRERLEAIAVSALEQSRGAWLPIVEPLTGLGELALRAGVVRADRGGRAIQATLDRLVVVGPEGGWTDDERRLVPVVVGLPGGVLRAETAAIVAGALLVNG